MKKKIKKPQTELQKLACKENYAIFHVRSMIANLTHIQKVLGYSDYYELLIQLQLVLDLIKLKQFHRKEFQTQLKEKENQNHESI